MDPFATFGIERRFDVNLPALEKRHRELSRALHPDKFADAGPSERKATLAKAVEVNEAWRVLRDPITRAEALFALAGVSTDERNAPRPSGQLLSAALELREALEEAKEKRDLAAIEKLAGHVDASRRAAEEKLAAAFADGGAKRAAVEALVPVLGELRFHKRFLDEVSAIEDAIAEAEVAAQSRNPETLENP
jgi:molecular chaperone HscB